MKIIENITLTEDVTLISLQDSTADVKIISQIFEMISKANIDIDMISQTPSIGNTTNLSFTVSSDDFAKILVIAGKFRELNTNIKINVSSGNSKISILGDAMRGQPGVVSKVFETLAKENTSIIMVTTSEIDISLLVVKSDAESAIQALNKAFN
ncbi:MAG: ACT domain-containing protein [Oscillospiraceae bacterium]